MKYAFDWGGVLSDNVELRAMVHALIAQGHKVHIISVAWPDEDRAMNPTQWKIKHGMDECELHIIIETGNTQHGEEKVKIMKEIGCRVIFDDNQDVINHAKAAGFLALKVPYKDH